LACKHGILSKSCHLSEKNSPAEIEIRNQEMSNIYYDLKFAAAKAKNKTAAYFSL
jgi:hypothetical protein